MHTRIEHHCGRPLQRCICSKHTGGKIKEWEFKNYRKLSSDSGNWSYIFSKVNFQFDVNFFDSGNGIDIFFQKLRFNLTLIKRAEIQKFGKNSENGNYNFFNSHFSI